MSLEPCQTASVPSGVRAPASHCWWRSCSPGGQPNDVEAMSQELARCPEVHVLIDYRPPQYRRVDDAFLERLRTDDSQ